MVAEKTSPKIIILFCLFVYPVMFKFSPLLSYVYIYGIPFMYLMIQYRLFVKITKKQMIIMAMAIVLILFAYIYPTLHGTFDYSYINTSTFIFRKLIVYLFLSTVIVKEYGEKARVEHFMYYYAMTHAIYVLGTLLIVLVPSFKEIWFSVFAESSGETEELLKSYGYTFRIGWQGFSGYRVTLHCTFSCMFLLYLNHVRAELKKISFAFIYALCFLGNMFYGRIGLVITFICSSLALFIWNRKHFINIFKFLCGISIMLLLFYVLRDIPLITSWYNWITIPLFNFITTGSFNNYSVDRLVNMVFMPEWKTILWGDGYFTRNGLYYMDTDSGLMRNILFWGIFGTIVSYSMTIYSIWDLKKKNILLFVIFIMIFVAFEYKGDVYYEFVSLMLSMSFIDNLKYKYISKQWKPVYASKEIVPYNT